jgi:hypothetical protein
VPAKLIVPSGLRGIGFAAASAAAAPGACGAAGNDDNANTAAVTATRPRLRADVLATVVTTEA